MIDIYVGILLYLGIGLSVYLTFPNRKAIPIQITLPFIIFWFVLAIVFLFPAKPKEKQKGGD